MSIISFDHVTKYYRKDFYAPRILAVDDCSFSVNQGSITGFVGPNGAGKTTTLKMLMGLIHPSAGTIKLMDRPPTDPRSRAACAFVTEQPYFYSHLTAYESLKLLLQVQYGSVPGLDTRIQSALSRVELIEAAHKKVKEMSKGMQQRLNMAGALIMDAQLYVFDEPMSGLDPLGRSLFRTIFRDLIAQGRTVFFSTHILEDIESLCKEIVVLARGSLQYSGSVQHLLGRGYAGTEIICTMLTDDQKVQAHSRGLSVTDPGTGQTVLVVPSVVDNRAIQQWLSGIGAVIFSLQPKNRSLEDVLYNENGGDGSGRHEGVLH